MTIKDISRESGYGVGTVSRVLNGHADVSDTARAAIMAVVEKYNFRPNSNAKQLKQHNSNSVAILVKGVGNLLFVGMLERLQQSFQQANRAVAVYYMDESDDELAHAIQICREFKPTGILFLGGSLERFIPRFQEINLPSILVSTPGSILEYPNLSSISTDDTAGTRCSMGYLLDVGHRKVGVIAGFAYSQTHTDGIKNMSQLRLDGCIQACDERNVPFDPVTQTEKARYSIAGGYEAATKLLDRIPGLTALLAMSDVMAIGAMRAIRDRNLRVPEDVSVIGFDGITLSQYLTPRLTTIWQDTDRMAQRAVEILLSQMDGGKPPVHEIVPYRLIEGESVRNISHLPPR